MQIKKKLRALTTLGAAATALSLGLIAPTVGTANAATGSNTIRVAEGPGANPNYIFPFMSCQYFSVDNINQFQELAYRPLYWFGLGASSAYVPSLSTGNSPVFSHGNKTITITMKGWKFSDGQKVDAQSVMFFLNLYHAEKTNYCGYNKGFGIPDQMRKATGSGNTVTLTFTSSVNPNWILYNYLSEITPMPNRWDVTKIGGPEAGCATGAYGAASTDAACKNVFNFIVGTAKAPGEASKTADYDKPFWQSGTDGPWTISSYDNLGNVTFTPNLFYSGPVKAQPGIAQVKEIAETSSTAEEAQLQAGTLDLGFVDPTVLTSSAPAPGEVGANWAPIASKYTLSTGGTWAFNYAPFNFSTKNKLYAVLEKHYIREALQLGVDQVGIIKKVDKGYGDVIDSPLPPNTPNAVSGLPDSGVPNPYPFSISEARNLLTSNGWTIPSSGAATCTSPGTAAGDCGAGITQGEALNMSIVWASGSPSLDDTFNAEISDWKSIGFSFKGSEDTFNNVIADCSSASSFNICSWGGGWIYAPDYYPSGETLFTPTGGFNVGSYKNNTMTSLINATTFGTANLAAYATFAASNLPVLYQPQATGTGERIDTLKSTLPWAANPLENFMPEYLHF